MLGWALCCHCQSGQVGEEEGSSGGQEQRRRWQWAEARSSMVSWKKGRGRWWLERKSRSWGREESGGGIKSKNSWGQWSVSFDVQFETSDELLLTCKSYFHKVELWGFLHLELVSHRCCVYVLFGFFAVNSFALYVNRTKCNFSLNKSQLICAL